MSAELKLEETLQTTTRTRFDIALLIAIVPIAAATIRIWMYSGGDIALFLVLLRTINIPAVLVGTAVLLVPSLLLVGLVMILFDRKARAWIKARFARNSWTITVAFPVVGIVIGYTISWPYFVWLVIISACAVGYFFIRRFWQKRKVTKKTTNKKSFFGSTGPDSFIVLLSVVASFLVTPGNIWLPLEQVTITGRESSIGYVLESTSDWTTVLTKERTLSIIATSDLESRQLCDTHNPGTIALSMQKGGLKGGPDCD